MISLASVLDGSGLSVMVQWREKNFKIILCLLFKIGDSGLIMDEGYSIYAWETRCDDSDHQRCLSINRDEVLALQCLVS